MRKRPFQDLEGSYVAAAVRIGNRSGTVIEAGEVVRLGRYAGGWNVMADDGRSVSRVRWTSLRIPRPRR